MARGPLPNPERRRRNAPTIPTTNLPASGRSGPTPSVPSWVKLGKAGRAWWRWAWSTPQAAAWGTNVGQESVVARRASLEDDLDALERCHGLDFDALDDDGRMSAVVRRLASLATGRLALMRETRELDDRLGLTPKGLAALRWKIVEDGDAAAAPTPAPGTTSTSGRYGHLRTVGE